MKFFCLLVCLSLFSGACNRLGTGVPITDKGKPAPGKRNEKYHLEFVFHMMGVTKGNDIVDGVSIRDINKGEEVKFEPRDQQSLLLGDGYIRNVSWSPDQEYLILPFGQFDGFCVIKSSEALKSIREKKYFDTIRIQLNTGLQMSHEFANWDGNTAFIFKAGMESQFPKFKYEISSHHLSALEKTNDIFEAYNVTGKLVIERK